MEQVIDELYDGHAHLLANTANSPRLLPSGSDIYAEWRDGQALIVAVRPHSPAAAAGLRPGMEILAVNGQHVAEATAERQGKYLKHAAAAARDHALRAALAGRRSMERTIRVRAGGSEKSYRLGRDEPQDFQRPAGLLEQRRLGEFGYIRIHNSLGNSALIPDFDAALAALRDTRGLILDLRDTPSGGNTTVGRAILGRFIAQEAPYQKHSLPSEARGTGIVRSWLELVSPRGDFQYGAPLVVLVDRWTGSMGEGISIGLDGLGRARILGSPMAGLLGATYSYRLDRTGIGLNLPVEKLFHVDGTAREQFRPAQAIDELKSRPGTHTLLAAGLDELRRPKPTGAQGR